MDIDSILSQLAQLETSQGLTRQALTSAVSQIEQSVTQIQALIRQIRTEPPAPAPPTPEPPQPDSYWTPTVGLNFRTGPGTHYSIIRTLTPQEKLGRLEDRSPWFKLIDTQGTVGWASREYLRVWSPATRAIFGGTVSDPWDYNSDIETMIRAIRPGSWVVVTHGGVTQRTLEMMDRVSTEQRGVPMQFLIRPLIKFEGGKSRDQIYGEFNRALDPLWPYLRERMHIIIYNETNLDGEGAREGYKVQWPDPQTFGYAFLDAGIYLSHRYPGATLHYPAASPVPVTGSSPGVRHHAHNDWVAGSSWAAKALTEYAPVAIDIHTYTGNGVTVQKAVEHVKWVCDHFIPLGFTEFHVTEFANGQQSTPKPDKARDLVALGAAIRALPYPIYTMNGYTGYASTDYFNQSWLHSEMVSIIAQRPY